MITDGLISLGAWIVSGVLGVLPSIPVPGFIADGSGMLAQMIGLAAGFGHWIPFAVIGIVLVAVFACVAGGFGLKLGRIVASYLTAGGGSAG